MSRPNSSRPVRRNSPPENAFGLQPIPRDHQGTPSTPMPTATSSTSRHTTPRHSPRPSGEYAQSASSATPRSSSSTSSSRNGWNTTGSGNEDEAILSSHDGEERGWRRDTGGARGRENTTRSWTWLLHNALDSLGVPRSGEEHVKMNRRKGSKRDKEKSRSIGIWNDRHPPRLRSRLLALIPRTLLGIVSFLLCFIMFAATLTMTLKFVLNPDKAALPWRQYCSSDYPTSYSLQDPSMSNRISANLNNLIVTPLTPRHPSWPYTRDRPYSYEANQTLDELEPVGVFVGVFSMDSGVKRRELVRHSYAAHPKSRTEGTRGVRVRFIIGRPRAEYAAAVKAEQEEFGDIVILDIEENMNSGKSHAYLTWAATGATVPHYEYTRQEDGHTIAVYKGERPAQYVIKADDDAFLMLGELERRLRVAPREKAYWGYLVKNRFMGGECYGLSMDLVNYVATTPALRSMTHGKEDVLVSKWLRLHPESQSIVWATDKCWMYDHPKSGTVYSHGFLYPSEVANVRQEQNLGLDERVVQIRGGQTGKDAYSTVTKFGTAYRTFDREMTREEKVEALVEGSPLSKLRDERLYDAAADRSDTLRQRISRLYDHRPTRQERFLYDSQERGGTVLVHYIKKPEWFRETMLAMLGTVEPHPAWKEEGQPDALAAEKEEQASVTAGWTVGREYGVLRT